MDLGLRGLRLKALGVVELFIIGAEIITCTFFFFFLGGGRYHNYSIIYPNTLFEPLRPLP